MADDKKSVLPELKQLSSAEWRDTSILQDTNLIDAIRAGNDLRYRAPVQDAAVGMLDTLQSIGSIALAPLPGFTLADAAGNSQFLDEFRSPAYLAERQSDAERNATVAERDGEMAGLAEAAMNALDGGNLGADLATQVPYLMIGPAARAMGVAAKTAVPGILSRGLIGTGELATVNRIAALSGVLEGASSYGQTYQRALAQTGDEEEALRQARLSGAFNTVVGAVLGKLTPGFEMDPMGIKRNVATQFLGDALAPALSNVAGEMIEEGGMALSQTVTDNVLAGKAPLEGVGAAVGEAIAISGAFSGGMQSPGVVRGMSKAIGVGVVKGLNAIANRATTAEAASVEKVAAANADVSVPAAEEVAAPAEEPAAPMTLEEFQAAVNDPANWPNNELPSEEERAQAVQMYIQDQLTPSAAPVQVEAEAAPAATEAESTVTAEPEAASTEPTPTETASPESVETVTTPAPVEAAPAPEAATPEPTPAAPEAPAARAALKAILGGKAKEKKPVQMKLGLRKSRRKGPLKTKSQAVKALLTDADTDAIIENSTGDTQLEALQRKESIAPAVARAEKEIAKKTDKEIADLVQQASEGNEEAALQVEAVARVDMARLPDSVIDSSVQPVVNAVRELKQDKADDTSADILTRGFTGKKNSRGIEGYVQGILNHVQAAGDTTNEAANNLIRFVGHLENRAQAFRDALAQEGDNVPVEGTATRDSKGKLTNDPFIIHKNSEGSMKTVARVFEDVRRARETLDAVRNTFPKMFAAPVEAAPVAAASAPAAPTPRSAPVATTQPATETVAAPATATAATEATAAEQTSTPTPEPATGPANPLLAKAEWASPRFLDSFKVNPDHTLGQMFEAAVAAGDLRAEDETKLRNAATVLARRLRTLFDQAIAEEKRPVEWLRDQPWAYMVHAWVKKGDGYEVSPALRHAVAIATTLHMYRAATRYSIETTLDDEGKIRREATPEGWAHDIAHDAATILGIKPKRTGDPETDPSESITQGVLLSLALTGVEATVAEGDVIKTFEAGYAGKDAYVVIPTEALQKDAVENLEFIDRVSRALDGPAEFEASLEPPTGIAERIQGSEVSPSESQVTAIANREKVKHFRNPMLHKFLTALGEDNVVRLLVGTQSVRKDMPAAVYKLLKARVKGWELELRAIRHYNSLITDEQTDGLHWKYHITANGRTTSKLGPQGYKLIRDLYTSARTTLDLGNEGHLNALKMTIAQAFGSKTDINGPAKVLEDYDRFAEVYGDVAKALVAAVEVGDGDALYESMRREKPYSPRELVGLLTLGQLLNQGSKGTFESYISFEIDGKTNGAFNTEMLFGLSGLTQEWRAKQTIKNLEQGGAFINKPNTTWAEQYARMVEDLYTRVAKDAMAVLSANVDEWVSGMEAKGKGAFAVRAIAEQKQLMQLTGLMSTDDNPVFKRDAAKAASNPIVYGAGVKGIANQLIGEMRSSLVDKWLEYDSLLRLTNDPLERTELLKKQAPYSKWLANNGERFDEVAEYAAMNAARALKEAYRNNKFVVSYVTELMVKITTLAYAVKKAQWDDKHEEALQKYTLNKDIPLTNEKGKKSGRWTLPSSWYRLISQATLEMKFSTAANEMGISLDDTRRQPTQFRVQGMGTQFAANLNIAQASPPGVRILALLTQAAGDGAMGNAFLQVFRAVTDVFDGIEFKVDEFMAGGEALNEAVWQTAQHDALADFVKLVDNITANITDLSEERQKAIIKAYNEAIPESEEPVNSFRQFAGFVKGAGQGIRQAHQQQREGLAILKSTPNTILQMGGGRGKTTDATPREAIDTPAYRKGWNEDTALAFEINNGRLDRTGVVALLDGVKWSNPVQRMVWRKLRTLLPAGITVRLAKNAEEWNGFFEGTPSREYGRVAGVMDASTGSVLLATASPSVMLHELMHSVFTNTLSNYFANPNMVPSELRAPINDLKQLLARFKKLKSEAAAPIQALVSKLEEAGDTAAAIDEMLAYTLTEADMIEQATPGLVTRIVTRAKQLLWGLVGRDVPGSFLDEAIKAFNTVGSHIVIDAQSPTMNTREHVDLLEAKIANAFAGIIKKIQKNQHFHVPKIATMTHLVPIMQQYNLSPVQQRTFKQMFLLLRMETRPAELEQFVSAALPNHPQAALFNGAPDAVASVMALAAVDDTFKAQLENLYNRQRKAPTMVSGLLDKALGNLDAGDVDKMLSHTLKAIAEDAEYQMSWLGTVSGRLDRMGSEFLAKVGEKAAQAAQAAPQGVDDLLQGIHALTTEEGADAFGKGLLKVVNNTRQRWLQDLGAALLGTQDDNKEVYRQLSAAKNHIAQNRALFNIELPNQLKKLFPAGFDGWNHLFKHYGRLDASILGADAAQMYSDDAARRRMITALSSRVENYQDAENLGYYLAKGKVNPNSARPLLRNARSIADNMNESRRRTATDEQVATVDQLVTLYAIDALAPSDRVRMAGYFRDHPRAMEHLRGMLQKVQEEEAKQLNDRHRYVYWKGHLPLSTDARASVVLASDIEGAELEALGYTKGPRYKRTQGDPANNLHYWTRDYAPPPVFTQGILATVQQTAMGVNYTTAATITPEVGTMIASPRLVQWIKDNQGVGSTLVPIFDEDGELRGYERLLDQEFVQKTTRSDNTLLHISIGQKLGRIFEERAAKQLNEVGVQILVNQWERGQRDGEQDQYEPVNSSTDKQVARAWEMIPSDTKRALEEAFGGEVMIRKDLLANTIGYYKAGLLDVVNGDASLSLETRKVMLGVAQAIPGVNTVKYLLRAETAIKEGVATAKDFIIVRSLSVAISNAMAAMNAVVSNGVPLKELALSYREGMKDMIAYARLQREVIELTVKIAGASAADAKKFRTLQDAKREQIKRLAIYPLIEAGDLSDLPEGLEETPSSTYLGDMSGWLYNHLNRIHPKASMVVANAALAKDSQFHNAISKAIQAGDFLARWAIYKHLTKQGMESAQALDVVRDELIAYQTNAGRFRGILEDYGLGRWTQFTLRAQKVLLRRFRQNPFSFFVAQSHALATGSDGPLDMIITNRGWDNSTGWDDVVRAPSAHIYAKLF